MEIGNKYTTFFFEEYEKMAEKNTFSAFLPSENKGLWCMSKVDNLKKNLAKMAVEKIVEEYLKNDSISVENIDKNFLIDRREFYIYNMEMFVFVLSMLVYLWR